MLFVFAYDKRHPNFSNLNTSSNPNVVFCETPISWDDLGETDDAQHIANRCQHRTIAQRITKAVRLLAAQCLTVVGSALVMTLGLLRSQH